MKCEACGSQVAAGELSPSGAGQWLCRWCMARYSIEIADRRTHALQVYRRCSCGAEMVPEDEGDVPLYITDFRGRNRLNLSYAFRATKYGCPCGRRFKLRHPALLTLGVVAFGAIALVNSRPADTRPDAAPIPRAVAVTVAVTLALVVLAHQLYYRWRFPRVR